MYLISVYFDEKTSKKLNHLIQSVAEETGNTFMLDHKVPPHMTIGAFETRHVDDVARRFEDIGNIYKDLSVDTSIQFVSTAVMFPYVIYVAPVLNEYLQHLSEATRDFIKTIDDAIVSKYYGPYHWMPHVTIGKTLDEEQMRKAFDTMQRKFVSFEGEIVRIGIAKTNPHKDLAEVLLKNE